MSVEGIGRAATRGSRRGSRDGREETWACAWVALLVVLLGVVGCTSDDDDSTTPGSVTVATSASTTSVAAPDPALQASIEAAMRAAVDEHHLRALIVRVEQGGREVFTGALGESMNGVPATVDMHVRNGAVAYSYLARCS